MSIWQLSGTMRLLIHDFSQPSSSVVIARDTSVTTDTLDGTMSRKSGQSEAALKWKAASNNVINYTFNVSVVRERVSYFVCDLLVFHQTLKKENICRQITMCCDVNRTCVTMECA